MSGNASEWLRSISDAAPQFYLGTVEFSARISNLGPDPNDPDQALIPEEVDADSPFTLLLDLSLVSEIGPAVSAYESRDINRPFHRATYQFDTALVAANEDRLRDDFSKFELDPTGRQWWLFEIRHAPGPGTEVLFYDDLALGVATRAWILSIIRVPNVVQDVLASFASLDDVTDASEAEIESAVNGVSGGEIVAVYDVGQGNCNAICNPQVLPVLFYDFGRPLSLNSVSAPNPFPVFCFPNAVPIILSHWDFDHWGAAKLPKPVRWSLPALRQTWIAPRQYLGPMHLSLAAAILAHGTLRVWAIGGPRSVRFPNGRIVQCTGKNTLHISQRNDSGLALFAHHRSNNGSSGDVCLLTGDADFPYIPFPPGWSIEGLVAPHHGARISGKNVPSPVGFRSWLSISVGNPNRYGHPSASALTQYSSNGWPTPVQTDSRPARCKQTLQHIGGAGFHLSSGSVSPFLCCSHTTCTKCLVQ